MTAVQKETAIYIYVQVNVIQKGGEESEQVRKRRDNGTEQPRKRVRMAKLFMFVHA